MKTQNNIAKREPITEKVQTYTVTFGCDPEFFFEKNGQIIGSEKIIDINKGLIVQKDTNRTVNGSTTPGQSKFIVDGVQAEINPKPDTCRARLGNEISQCFRTLYKKMQEDKDLKVNFLPTVKINKKELMSLDAKSRVFGCSPSKNIDKKSQNIVSLRDPAKYKYRSAGGHIHIGSGDNYGNNAVTTIMKEPERLVAIMDIIVGNTCVLIDRDPGNKERRKVYGRAGEYRTPKYGIEYRTLSNFWLRSYPLMSFVMNLSRLSVNILASSMPGRDFERELLETVDIKKVRKAINTNNFDLAWANFQKIKPFLVRTMQENGDNFPLTINNIGAFEFFVAKGLDFWFKENPIEHWMKIPEGHTCGWENFLKNIVTPKMMEENPSPTPAIK
ncbi:MAG: hypothetical protein WC917_00015 [Bacilli bacterium]|jgi:hypothetical protein